MGKRQRPIVEKIERPPLTEKSLVKSFAVRGNGDTRIGKEM